MSHNGSSISAKSIARIWLWFLKAEKTPTVVQLREEFVPWGAEGQMLEATSKAIL